MTLNTARADVVRAVAESVGYAAKHCLEAAGLRVGISICGGGAESMAWRQVLADVLQQPLKVARRPEVGGRGAAMAAMTAAGMDFDHDEWTRPEDHVESSGDLRDLYERGFERCLATVEANRGLWNKLHDLPRS